jgi:hypothetical protein
MSIPRRVLKIVARSLKGVFLCKSLLVVSPTEHILRGFLIDRTAHKSKYNLWKVVVPLYTPMHLLILDYSTQIGPRGDWLTIEKHEIQDAAQRVTGYILDGHLDHLKRLRGPKEFLEYVSWMIGNTTDHFLFDYAMTQYMLGNQAACLASLQAMRGNEPIGMPRPNIFTCSKELIAKLATNPSEVAEMVRQFERANVEQFALEPTIINPRPQLAGSN